MNAERSTRSPSAPTTGSAAGHPPCAPGPAERGSDPLAGQALLPDAWRSHGLDLGAHADGQRTREWLLTNGTGAYAMGSLPGVNTRRYHGLLVAATRPPVGRVVALNQVFEQLTLPEEQGGKVLEFTSCVFREKDGNEVYAPAGWQLLRRFEKGLDVAWSYAGQGVSFTRTLSLVWQRQAALIRYRIEGLQGKAQLRLNPMVTLRDFHHLCQHAGSGDLGVHSAAGDTLIVRRGDLHLTMRCPGSRFEMKPHWWYQIHYPGDAERGQDHREDYYVPGSFVIELDGRQQGPFEVELQVALGEEMPAQIGQGSAGRAAHLQAIAAQPAAARLDPVLLLASDDFLAQRVVKGKTLATIIAGFPWFGDWGRDTFIALPGLLLATGRLAEARAVLQAFADFIKDGLTPNCFDEHNDQAAHYNTVDASLWYVHAALQYLQVSQDQQAWEEFLRPAAMSILEAYIHGTSFGIRMTGDGLISAGSNQTQLTWMDAACNGVVFTPRHGKAVEINALWFNALSGMAIAVSSSHSSTADHYQRLCQRIRRSFIKVFWDEQRKYLIDHVWTDEQNQDHPDPALRCNQILALSLPHSPLPRTKQVLVLATIEQKLLTPYGLRTLSSDDANYHGRYAGDGFARDRAYHQGTVWPWLIGPYAEAVLRVNNFTPVAQEQARQAIEPLLHFLHDPGLGQLYEIHDADLPHYPKGCIAQAWSVAEVLRVLHLLEQGPPAKH